MTRFSNRARAAPRGMFRRAADLLLAVVFLAVVAIGAAKLSGNQADAGPGAVRVIDGDSLQADGVEVRLWGIDAPEFNQTCVRNGTTHPCGREARARLKALVESAGIQCKGFGSDQYGRLLAVCRTPNGEVNAAMVREGFAFSYGGYASEEAEAKSAMRGVWAGEAEQPRAFRERTKAAADAMPGLFSGVLHSIDRLLNWVAQGSG
jgi:endonuclease YncB( thermonuclease family)